MESTFYQLSTITSISSNYNYVIDVDNDDIRNLLEFSWSNFFSTYSILLSETTDVFNFNIPQVLAIKKIYLIISPSVVSDNNIE